MTQSDKPGKSTLYLWLPLGLVALFAVAIGAGILLWLADNQPRSGPQLQARPRMSVSPTKVDYGDVKLHTPIEAVFRVSNVGDEPLKILGQPRIEAVEGC